MNVYELEIPESITGKQRPRMNTYTGKAYIYKYPKFEPFEGKIKLNIIAYFELPKKVSKTKEEEMLTGKIRPTKRPDIDNITKIILDALNKFAYKDDAQIVEATTIKMYARTPKVLVRIEDLEEN